MTVTNVAKGGRVAQDYHEPVEELKSSVIAYSLLVAARESDKELHWSKMKSKPFKFSAQEIVAHNRNIHNNSGDPNSLKLWVLALSHENIYVVRQIENGGKEGLPDGNSTKHSYSIVHMLRILLFDLFVHEF